MKSIALWLAVTLVACGPAPRPAASASTVGELPDNVRMLPPLRWPTPMTLGWVAGAYRLALEDDRVVLADQALPATIIQVRECGRGVLIELDDHRWFFADDFLGSPRWVGQLNPPARRTRRDGPDLAPEGPTAREARARREPRRPSGSQVLVRGGRVLVAREGAMLRGRCGAELEPVPFHYLDLSIGETVAVAISDRGVLRHSDDTGQTWSIDHFDTPLAPPRGRLATGTHETALFVDGVLYALREAGWQRIGRDELQPRIQRHLPDLALAVEGYLTHRARTADAVLALLHANPEQASLHFDSSAQAERGFAGCGLETSSDPVSSSVDRVLGLLSTVEQSEPSRDDLYLREAGRWRRERDAVPGHCRAPTPGHRWPSHAEGCELLPGPELLLRCAEGDQTYRVHFWSEGFHPMSLAESRDGELPALYPIAPLQALDAHELIYPCGVSVCVRDLGSGTSRTVAPAPEQALWVAGGYLYAVDTNHELVRYDTRTRQSEQLGSLILARGTRFEWDASSVGLAAYRPDGSTVLWGPSGPRWGWTERPELILRSGGTWLRRSDAGSWASSRDAGQRWSLIQRPVWAARNSSAPEINGADCSVLGCRLTPFDLVRSAPATRVAQVRAWVPPPTLYVRCAERERLPASLVRGRRIRWTPPETNRELEARQPERPPGHSMEILETGREDAFVAVSGPGPPTRRGRLLRPRPTTAVCIHRVTADGVPPGPCIRVGPLLQPFAATRARAFERDTGWVLSVDIHGWTQGGLMHGPARHDKLWIGLDPHGRELWRREIPAGLAQQTLPGPHTATEPAEPLVPTAVCTGTGTATDRTPMRVQITVDGRASEMVMDLWIARERTQLCVSEMYSDRASFRAVEGRLEGTYVRDASPGAVEGVRVELGCEVAAMSGS